MYIGLRASIRYSCQNFNQTSIFSTGLSNSTQISHFMEIVRLGAALFRADGRTDIHDEAGIRFPPIFANAPPYAVLPSNVPTAAK
jgi:hypothetical protein